MDKMEMPLASNVVYGVLRKVTFFTVPGPEGI